MKALAASGSRGRTVRKTNWSFLSCLTPPTPETEARARFRTAVHPQVESFRDRLRATDSQLVYPITGETLTDANVHIDHEIPFDDLFGSFLREHGLVLANIKVNPTVDGSTTTELADLNVRGLWQEYIVVQRVFVLSPSRRT